MQKTHFVVRRQNWRPFQNRHVRLPGFVPVASFQTHEEAVTECRRLTVDTWMRINPFRFDDSFNDVLNYPVPIFSDWLNEQSVLPPAIESSREEWAIWWVEQSRHWTMDDWLRILPGFGKLQLFDIVNEPEPCVFAFGFFEWGVEEGQYRTGESNSESFVFLERENAARQCDVEQRDYLAQQQQGYMYYRPDVSSIWSRRQEFASIAFESDMDSFESMISSEYYRVPCFAEQLKTGQRYYAIERMAMRLIDGSFFQSNGGQIIAIYDNKQFAEESAWECDASERPFLNPFRYFGDLRAISSLTVSGLQSMFDDVTVRMPSQIMDKLRGTGSGMPELRSWWSEVSPWLNYVQRNLVWDMLDQLRFYRVREVTLR